MTYSLLTMKTLCETTREKCLSSQNPIDFFGDFPGEGRFALVFLLGGGGFPTFSLFPSELERFFFAHQGWAEVIL